MHHKNNNNGADRPAHRSADALRSSDPYLAEVTGNADKPRKRCYSEAMHTVMDEMQGTATSRRMKLSRRAKLYNLLRH